MRVKTFEDKTIIFTEKEYKQICRRFNYNKYKKTYDGMGSSIKCPLCERYAKGTTACEECPVAIYETLNSPGCMVIMHKILGLDSIQSTFFYADAEEAGYQTKFEEDSIKELDIINAFLMSFDSVTPKQLKILCNTL